MPPRASFSSSIAGLGGEAAGGPEAAQRPFFVHAYQPRITDKVGGEDRGTAARRHDQNAPVTAERADPSSGEPAEAGVLTSSPL